MNCGSCGGVNYGSLGGSAHHSTLETGFIKHAILINVIGNRLRKRKSADTSLVQKSYLSGALRSR